MGQQCGDLFISLRRSKTWIRQRMLRRLWSKTSSALFCFHRFAQKAGAKILLLHQHSSSGADTIHIDLMIWLLFVCRDKIFVLESSCSETW